MGTILSCSQRAALRKRVAEEAAAILYTEQEKEYKQAKLRAAKTLGLHFLPSNAEVAAELDRISEEREGEKKKEKLVQMRLEALQIMQVLRDFSPMLVGSVWRGTAHLKSDIDIIVYAKNEQQIVSKLYDNHYTVTKIEAQAITKKGKKEHTFHIYLNLPSNTQAEIVVHSAEHINRRARCEIYGDTVTGLSPRQLWKVLKENPQQRFLPP
jgi:predicted nucleotidyltransferase